MLLHSIVTEIKSGLVLQFFSPTLSSSLVGEVLWLTFMTVANHTTTGRVKPQKRKWPGHRGQTDDDATVPSYRVDHRFDTQSGLSDYQRTSNQPTMPRNKEQSNTAAMDQCYCNRKETRKNDSKSPRAPTCTRFVRTTASHNELQPARPTAVYTNQKATEGRLRISPGVS
jgi:hypothetical protein